MLFARPGALCEPLGSRSLSGILQLVGIQPRWPRRCERVSEIMQPLKDCREALHVEERVSLDQAAQLKEEAFSVVRAAVISQRILPRPIRLVTSCCSGS